MDQQKLMQKLRTEIEEAYIQIGNMQKIVGAARSYDQRQASELAEAMARFHLKTLKEILAIAES